jgi:cell division septal protein FtsQ
MNKTKVRIQERRKREHQRKTLIFMVTGGILLIVAGFTIAKSALSRRADSSLVEVSGQPSLKVDKELIDYGDVKLNTNLTFDLKLTNVGDETLKISETPYVEVKEGC